jgi:hypothetical protein
MSRRAATFHLTSIRIELGLTREPMNLVFRLQVMSQQ